MTVPHRLAIAAVSIVAMTAGCATTQTLDRATLNPVEHELPAIRLLVDDGQEGDVHVVNYQRVIDATIQKSGVFKSINSEFTDNHVAIFLLIVDNKPHSALAELADAATLMVIPETQDLTFKLRVVVHSDSETKVYNYEDRRKWTGSLLNPQSFSADGFNATVPVDSVKNMVIHFLNDVRKDHVLDPPPPTTTT